jgi:limonene-1,2-epoxide hydrolase
MIVEQFKSTYQNMNASNIASIESLYAEQIEFNHPFHKVIGLRALKNYFEELYENVDSVSFSFGECINQGDQYFIEWEMTVCHPKLNKGEPILVPGATLFKVDQQEKIIFHRDYFDAGVMLYEHIPLLGRLIKWVKGRI